MPSLEYWKRRARSSFKAWDKAKAKTKKAADKLDKSQADTKRIAEKLAYAKKKEKCAEADWVYCRDAYEIQAMPDDSDFGSTHETADE
jgi:uncharacterized membrane protein